MNSPDLPNVIHAGDEQRHKAVEILDALQNLLYLIRIDAERPAEVLAYADQTEDLLSAMHQHLLPS